MLWKDDYFRLSENGAKEYRRKEAEETSRVLKNYGEVTYGDTISRDVIVPGDMPLWALNYVIQKGFGWHNSHLQELHRKSWRKQCSLFVQNTDRSALHRMGSRFWMMLVV